MKFERKLGFRVLGVIAGLIFAGFGAQERLEYSRILKRGERAVVEPPTEYSAFGTSGSPTYTGQLRFTTRDGREINVKHSFPEEVLEAFKAGQPVEVAYLPSEPNHFVFANERPSLTLVFIGAAMAVASFIFI